MGAGVSLVSDIENVGLLLFAGLNMIVFVSMLGKSSNHILGGKERNTLDANKNCIDARMRSSAFFSIALVIATAGALKLVLPKSLADQIIAAWFVGQGFALQSFVRSYISGMQIRNNTVIWGAMLEGKLTERGFDNEWEICTDDTSVFAIALISKLNSGSNSAVVQRRIILWHDVHAMIISK